MGIDERVQFKYSLTMPKNKKTDKSVYFGNVDHTGKKITPHAGGKSVKGSGSRKQMVGTPRKTG